MSDSAVILPGLPVARPTYTAHSPSDANDILTNDERRPGRTYSMQVNGAVDGNVESGTMKAAWMSCPYDLVEARQLFAGSGLTALQVEQDHGFLLIVGRDVASDVRAGDTFGGWSTYGNGQPVAGRVSWIVRDEGSGNGNAAGAGIGFVAGLALGGIPGAILWTTFGALIGAAADVHAPANDALERGRDAMQTIQANGPWGKTDCRPMAPQASLMTGVRLRG